MIASSYIVRTDDNRGLDVGLLRCSVEAREWLFIPAGGEYAYSVESLSDIARQMATLNMCNKTEEESE